MIENTGWPLPICLRGYANMYTNMYGSLSYALGNANTVIRDAEEMQARAYNTIRPTQATRGRQPFCLGHPAQSLLSPSQLQIFPQSWQASALPIASSLSDLDDFLMCMPAFEDSVSLYVPA